MKMNRRNVLVGLGTIVAGGGAALGTGAFSSVSADRTVSITTTNDSNALLALELTDTSYTGVSAGNDGTGEGTIEIDINRLNDNAITTFENVLTVSNNGSKTVNLSVKDAPAALTFKYGNDNDLSNTDKELDTSDGDGDTSVVLTIEVDLKNHDVPGEGGSVTFSAESTESESTE